ncbi:MAG: Pycsar system effector family protein [Flammeovirgaceae bacterium]
MQSIFDCGVWINTAFAAIVFTGIGSILLTLAAGIPFLGKPDNSVLYFRSISSKTLSGFSEQLASVSNDDVVKDYTNQVHQLSKGLTKKFIKLQIAGYLIFVQFLMVIPLVIMLMKNIKVK